MELYIRIVDGQPFEHPIEGSNFRQAFPNIDTNNLPVDFARFVRVAPPSVGVYEVYTGVTYELVDGVYTDVHRVEPMTEQQKADKQDEIKSVWAANGGFPSWIFDKETCSFNPPLSYPLDGKNYIWDEPTTSWIEVSNA